MRGYYGVAADGAVAYGRLNRVENAIPTITTADIEPGIWDFANRQFSPPATPGNWADPSVNAVRATSRYPARYKFGKIFGLDTSVRSARSVAAVGGVGATGCVRPLSIPYRDLLDALPGGTSLPLTWVLTEAQVDLLAGVALSVPLLSGVQLPPIKYADGFIPNPGPWGTDQGSFEDGVGFTCDALASKVAGRAGRPYVGIGDWLEDANGTMASVSDGVVSLCQQYGLTSPSTPQTNKDFDCLGQVDIKVAIWDEMRRNVPGVKCVQDCYRVKYIGAVRILGYRKAGKVVLARFSSLASEGTFSFAPGPVKKIALVQ